jgi:4-amino-4-deoxy-L-arabinose transferase-like glycosyltransferase
MKNFLKEHWIIGAIMLVAVFFRFWQIDDLPGGLFPDEAANGLDINLMFDGQLQPFYERGNGREALFFYVIWAVVALFGRGPWQHHVVSAGFGVVEVFTAYLLTKRLFGKRVALLASFLMAVSSYAVTISRTAFRANTIPLFTTLTLYFLVRFFQAQDRRGRVWSAFWAGVSFGLGFYTYISYRMMIPLLLGFAMLMLVGYRDRVDAVKECIKSSWGLLVGFLLSFSWLGYYFLSHPGSFIGRAGQVSIFSPDLNQGDIIGTFLNVLKLTMLSFFTAGDLNWRHNVSGYPFLSFFLSPFFLIGLVFFSWSMFRLLKQVVQRQVEYNTLGQALIAVLFWFMLIPEVTTAEGIPHGLRLIGVIPAIFIMSAYPLVKIWEWVAGKVSLQVTRYAIPAVFLGGLLIYNHYLYFGLAANSPDYYYAFRSDLTTVSTYLNERNDKENTYLSLDKFSVQTVDYLTTQNGQPYQLLDPAKTYEVELKSGDQVVFTMSTLYDIKKFLEHHPDVQQAENGEVRNSQNYLIMKVYQQP